MNLIEVPAPGGKVKAEMVEGVWQSDDKTLEEFLNIVENPNPENSAVLDSDQVKYCAELVGGTVLDVDDGGDCITE